MEDDEFKALNQLEPPAPSADAKRRALEAGLLAFDRAQASRKESALPTQGMSAWRRLKSIVPQFKGNWIMDSRFVPVGTAALVLLLLPLGYQLYTSTSLTPPRVGDIKTEVVATNTSPLAVPKPGQGPLALPAD